MKTTIEVRLLAYTHLTDKTAVMSFASQETDINGRVEKTWMIRTVLVDNGTLGSSLIAEQRVKTEDLRPMLAKTSTVHQWDADARAALALVRSM